jgi:hypothetical protein
MFVPFARCISVDNLGISFGKCYFCYTYLSVHEASIYFVMRSVYGRLPLLLCSEKVNNPSYFFANVCEGNPFCFLVLRVSMCFVYVGEVVF